MVFLITASLGRFDLSHPAILLLGITHRTFLLRSLNAGGSSWVIVFINTISSVISQPVAQDITRWNILCYERWFKTACTYRSSSEVASPLHEFFLFGDHLLFRRIPAFIKRSATNNIVLPKRRLSVLSFWGAGSGV